MVITRIEGEKIIADNVSSRLGTESTVINNERPEKAYRSIQGFESLMVPPQTPGNKLLHRSKYYHAPSHFSLTRYTRV